MVCIKHLYHDMKRVSVDNNGNLWWVIKDEIHCFKEMPLNGMFSLKPIHGIVHFSGNVKDNDFH